MLSQCLYPRPGLVSMRTITYKYPFIVRFRPRVAEVYKADEAEKQLDQQARESEELRRQLQELDQEGDAVRLRLALERLKQLEEVRKQFDKEREWY